MILVGAHFAAFCSTLAGFANGNWVDLNGPIKVIVDCGTLEFEDGEQDNVEG